MKDEAITTVGTVIRRIREEKGMTIREMGERSGCNPGYLSRVERNESLPSFKKFGAICHALKVNPWMVLKESTVRATVLDPIARKIFDILEIRVKPSK